MNNCNLTDIFIYSAYILTNFLYFDNE